MLSVRFEDVGKLYRLGTVGTGTLCHDLNRWWQTRILRREDPYLKIGEANVRSERGKSDYVWALRNITLDIEEGQTVGCIGKNGAGKSTMLKLLSRVTAPTTGCIKVKGRMASLLEIGTGFHPELTGRENIYMNGSIMGMRKREITSRLDEIVDFAGVERYLDTPVKRYSSGMWVRLGFAIAAFLEPDILIVDEVLAVGDAEFQRKAVGKMRDVASSQGRTVLFVSHNMGAVRSLCERGIVLEDGQLAYDGNINDAIDYYNNCNDVRVHKQITDSISFIRSYLTINNITLNGTSASHSELSPNQETLPIIIEGHTAEPIKCSLKLTFKNKNGQPVASFVEGRVKGYTQQVGVGDFRLEYHIQMPKYLSRGEYHLDITLHQPRIQDFFRACDCSTLLTEGNADEFGTPSDLNTEGFLSLETAKSEE